MEKNERKVFITTAVVAGLVMPRISRKLFPESDNLQLVFIGLGVYGLMMSSLAIFRLFQRK